MTYRIHRSMAPGANVFALSGVLGAELATQLQELLETESPGHIVLDLKNVTLVDRDAITFLARVETEGVEIVNCPDYVRSWITAENDSR